jgi:hypothetical protein
MDSNGSGCAETGDQGEERVKDETTHVASSTLPPIVGRPSFLPCSLTRLREKPVRLRLMSQNRSEVLSITREVLRIRRRRYPGLSGLAEDVH